MILSGKTFQKSPFFTLVFIPSILGFQGRDALFSAAVWRVRGSALYDLRGDNKQLRNTDIYNLLEISFFGCVSIFK